MISSKLAEIVDPVSNGLIGEAFRLCAITRVSLDLSFTPSHEKHMRIRTSTHKPGQHLARIFFIVCKISS